METRILVTYATTHGATQEIAEVVAAELRKQGAAVDLQLASKVRSLEGYQVVVLGTPLYIFRLHRDAAKFLTRHQKALCSGQPLAVFAGGPYGEETDANTWQTVRESLERELAKFAWLSPVSVQVVGGRFDPAHLRFPWNLLPALRSMPPSDLRDWQAIRAWAASLVPQIAAVA